MLKLTAPQFKEAATRTGYGNRPAGSEKAVSIDFPKKRLMSKFDNDEMYQDVMGGGDTSTEARNAKMNASSRMPFSEFKNQLASDNDDGPEQYP